MQNQKCTHLKATQHLGENYKRCDSCNAMLPLDWKSMQNKNWREEFYANENDRFEHRVYMEWSEVEDFISQIEKEAYERGVQHGSEIGIIGSVTGDLKAEEYIEKIKKEAIQIEIGKLHRLFGEMDEDKTFTAKELWEMFGNLKAGK